ncbi:acyltransferase [Sphingopyxis sp. JAI128]|uniref:acyltransferase family protein n=1 Tax=Sphingopyxis sp. JAI128 TaxID=2723066 RepID=UPI00160E6F83|nr:acyltransferase [Sphingopyxis sp. JAI128]MBB6424555.1 peptidoglycan/LPS O-acetylase OafA/YrhL [Sphingopyxis sp. JAI128]
MTGLDGLRGVAAFAVLGYHLHILVFEASRGTAFLAVDFFFMLSGYVMARTYEARWESPSPAAYFMTSRLQRLWPTMAVGGAIGAVAAFIQLPVSDVLPMLLNLLLIPWFVGILAFPLNVPAWSILFELAANLAHVFVLRRLRMRSLVAIAALAGLVFVVGGRSQGLDVGSRPDNFLLGLPRVLMSYTIGIILWRSWRDKPAITGSPSFAFLAMPLIFGTSLVIPNASWIANLLFITIVCPMIMAGGLRFPAASRWSPVLSVAGAMSFPLYAVHVPAMVLVKYLGGHWTLSLATAIATAALFPSVRRAISAAMTRRRPIEAVA